MRDVGTAMRCRTFPPLNSYGPVTLKAVASAAGDGCL